MSQRHSYDDDTIPDMGTRKTTSNYSVVVWQNENGEWSAHCLNLELFVEARSLQQVMKELAYDISKHRRSTRS